jgi:osmotically-inducible protein OsmY
MKNDGQLQQDVLDEISWNPLIRQTNIVVTANGGTVTLTGDVDNYFKKYTANQVVQHVIGVTNVVMAIEVRHSTRLEGHDAEMEIAAQHALNSSPMVPTDCVYASVKQGWTTLSGELPQEYQRLAAEHAVRSLSGVNGVSNQIVIKHGIFSKNFSAGG